MANIEQIDTLYNE